MGATVNQILTSEGLCFFSQSFSAASMRVCQPLPVDLKASMTSGEYRTVADFFVGSTDTGLPRRMTFLPSCKLALSKKVSSNSGASSGSTQVLFKSFNFAFISFPHRNNAAHLIALRPDHNNKPGIQFSYGDLPNFPVVLSVILGGEVDPCENFYCSGEVYSTLQQCFFSLALVVFNIHTIIVVTLIGKSIFTNWEFGSYTVLAVAKSAVGRDNLEFLTAHNRAQAVFLCVTHSYIQSMVGRAGQPKGWPGSVGTGIVTPVRLTTHKRDNFGGGLFKFPTEAAIMATIPAISTPEVCIISGQVVTSSQAIADYFTKRHDDVLTKIRNLECSPEFNARNFAVVEYTDTKGELRPAYKITRDGFAFLAMGFTGKRAARFKESYITAFNQMEQTLVTRRDLSTCAQNAMVAYTYINEIHRVWINQLYPMLVAANSPIAVSLYDHINDAVFVASLLSRSLNGSPKKEVQR